MRELIRRNITLTHEDYPTVRQHARDWGQSFSAALRLIIREWKRAKDQTTTSNQKNSQSHS